MIVHKIQPTKDGKFVDTKSLLTDFNEDIRANFNNRNTAYVQTYNQAKTLLLIALQAIRQ